MVALNDKPTLMISFLEIIIYMDMEKEYFQTTDQMSY